MKKFFSKLPLLGVIAMICGLLTGCDPSNKKDTFSVIVQEAGPEYVHIQVTAPTAVELAYILDTKEKRVDNPQLIFTEGESLTVKPDDVVRISDGLKEDTQYYLYVVAKLDDINFSEIFTLPFKTTIYDLDELLTVVDLGYNAYKMRITVPEETKQRDNAIRYVHADLMTYNYMGSNDYTNLLYNGGAYTKFVKNDSTLVYNEDLNWYQTDQDADGDGELDWESHWMPISPGEPIVYIAGEFSWMEGDEDETNYVMFPAGWDPGYYMPLVSDAYFTAGAGDKEQSSMGLITDYTITRPTDQYWTGAFQRKHFRVLEPSVLEGGVEVKLAAQSPVDLTFEFYPDENVVQYVVGIFNESMYEQILELCGGREDYLQWAITSYFSYYTFSTMPFAGDMSMKLTDLYYQDAIAEDTEYYVLVTAMGDEAGSTQSYQKYTFKTTKKTKEAPEVLVTPLPEKSTPYEAVFNVKCTTFADNPFTECYYAANYVRDWLLAVNGGSTYFSLVAGNKAYSYFTAEELEKINSAEGLEVKIASIDGETTRLVILGYNDEYTPNDLVGFEYVEDCTGIADCTTPWLPEKDYVEESLYVDLVGDWTATATLQPATEGSKSFIHKSKITITDDLTKHHPATLTNDVYKLYEETSKYDKAKVDALYAEFKNLAEVVTKNRLTYQNRLVAMGWLDKDSYKRLDTYTPYDLFIDKTYKSVDVSSIFNDYGPKWYIEAVEDEEGNISYVAPFDANLLPPSANWSVPFYFSGLEPDTYYAVTYAEDGSAAFPVEVSEDRNTITIKPYVYTDKEGKKTTFYPNMIGVDNSTYSTILENSVVSDVVLTRGWTEPAEQKSASVLKSASNVQVEGTFPVKTYKQRTPLKVAPELETVETSLVTMEQFKERADKFIEMKFKQNN